MTSLCRDRDWIDAAVQTIEADFNRSADTHLLRAPVAGPVALYVKDESTHPTGSLKHRLARSLFLYALCNGWIGPKTTVVEASSGSTAVSEAYFARLLGLRFIAVMPRSTSAEKVAQIAFHGGESLKAGASQPTLAKVLLAGAAFTWLNPHVYLDTLGIMGAVSTGYPAVVDKIAFAIGAASASFVFFFSLGYGARLLAPLLKKPRAWQFIEVVIGATMWVIAFGLILSA